MASPKQADAQSSSLAPSLNGRSASSDGSPSQLVMLTAPHSAAAEAYRSLSVNLQFAGEERPVRLVAVTSPGPNEGKTTVVANIAIAMAEGGRRVIAVDADLRRPTLHTHFGLSNRDGLTNAVLGDGPALPLQDTLVPGLHVLTSGPTPTNPTHVLASPRLDRVLGLLVDHADFVVFDTAPAAALADTPVLTPRLDGTVLVVGAGRTKRDRARQAKEQLERVHARILGVVLTGVEVDKRLYAY